MSAIEPLFAKRKGPQAGVKLKDAPAQKQTLAQKTVGKVPLVKKLVKK